MTEENQLLNNQKPKRDYLLPVSILIAALLISGSLVYSVGKKADRPAGELTGNLGENPEPQPSPSLLNLRPVSDQDHIFGNSKAEAVVVEFSDLECPFCKRFHPTMKQVVADYGGKVAWVYRHFPLDTLHSKARKEAEATECAAELGGNEKFWSYVDRLFEVTPSNNGLDLSLLPQIAEDVGLNRQSFENCLASGKYANKVAADLEDATKSGGRGTPYSIVIAPDGKKYPISGALPYEQIKVVIDEALK